MKKLFVLIVLGLVFFIGGQWLGIEMRSQEHQSDTPKSDASTLEKDGAGGAR